MKWQLLEQRGDTRSYAVIFETGDAVMKELLRFASDQNVGAASFFAIGAFRRATLAFFEWEKKEYEHIEVGEQVEVVSLIGDIGRENGEPQVHIHCALGRRDGSAVVGHLIDADVQPTLELFLDAYPATLERVHDELSGLALVRPRD